MGMSEMNCKRLQTLLALAVLLAPPAIAQSCAAPTSIQINGTVNAIDGPMNGSITLQLNYSVPGSPVVAQSQMQLTVTSGVLYNDLGAPLICLPPSAVVVANYSVRNSSPMTGVTRFTRYWMVPLGGGPYTVGSVECTLSPSGCGIVAYVFAPSWASMAPALWFNLTPSLWGNLHP